MKAEILPYKTSMAARGVRVVITDDNGKSATACFHSDIINADPSMRELKAWGYNSLDEAIITETIFDIKDYEYYEKEIDYTVALSLVEKINKP